MKTKALWPLCLATTMLLFASCNSADTTTSNNVIGQPDYKVTDGKLTPELLWANGRLGQIALSPDGSTLAYTIGYTDIAEDKSNTDLYVMPAEGGEPTRLTTTAEGEYNLEWIDDRSIAFCRGNRIIRLTVADRAESVLAEFEEPIEGFRLAPDRQSLLYVATVPAQRPAHIDSLTAGMDKTTARINEDLLYRHWDRWVDDYPHIFVAPIREGVMQNGKAIDLLQGEPYECPQRPWYGIEQFNYSPDSKYIAYACRKKSGAAYATSTNSDIYLYNIAEGTTANISAGIMGYDMAPVFSPSGRYIAWESMERDGYESDKNRLMVMDLRDSTRRDISATFDDNISGIEWTSDESQILTAVQYRGSRELFLFGLDSTYKQLTHGQHYICSFHHNGNDIYVSQTWCDYPAEIYRYTLDGATPMGSKLTHINDELLAQLRLGRTEEHWMKTADGKEMLTWIVYPRDYDSTLTYPAVVYCLGGPQGMCSPTWGTRWNWQLFSANGYFVIAPNRRGCTGFGTQWCQQVSGDYGGLPMQDIMAATDQASKQVPAIDPNRIGACGGSFGGYSVFWLAGHNENHRYKAFFAHDGIFNFEQNYLETDEMYFVDWEFGGPYWANTPQTKHTYEQSPHRFIDKWNTPLCVVHSENDYRIVASQGMAAYNAARLRGIDARYLYYPDENHWVSKPQNTVVWNRVLIDWFDKYLK